jgi:hypothetical protein
VEITKKDYPNFWNCQGCPLSPTKVLALIGHVRDAGADVIGVDIDTCDDKDCDAARLPAQWNEPPAQDHIDKPVNLDKPGNPNVVWAEVPREFPRPRGSEDGPCLQLNPILGKREAELGNSGIVRFEQEDGIVRKQQARYKVYCDPSKCPETGWEFPSFYKAVIETDANLPKSSSSFLKSVRQHLEPTEGIYLNFPADDLLRVQASEFDLDSGNLSKLKGKIVLIGGSYEASDYYQTPSGKIPGVLLLADAIASELNGPIIPVQASRPLGFCLLFLLDALAGLIIMLLYSCLTRPVALAFSLLAIALVLLLAGPAVYWLKIWINPIFVMVGMLAHQEIEAAEKHKQKPSPEGLLLAEAEEHETDEPD